MENKLKEEVAKRLKSTVAERLKSLMEKKNLNQTEFSEITGISKDTVSKLVNENYSLSILNALLISEKFGVSLDYLYGRCEEENSNQYALEILQRHFCAYKEKEPWQENAPAAAYISFSTALADFLDRLTNLKEAKIPEDLRKEGVQRAKKTFISVIENEPENPRKYVLIDYHLFATGEIQKAIDKAKEEISGNPYD